MVVQTGKSDTFTDGNYDIHKLNTIHSGLDGSGDQHDLISLVEDIGPRMNQP